MSKIAYDDLTRSGTGMPGCFIAVPVWQQLASKGLTVKYTAQLLLGAVTIQSGP